MSDTEYVNIWMRPERPTTGRRPTYSRAQITQAAVRIADAEGLEAATMRRIAAEIGTGAMSLYRYVPSRDDLIELMADHLMGEIDITDIPSDDWRAALTGYANELRAMWLRHPWVATVHQSLPGLGPNQLLLIERVMGALDPLVSIDENLRIMAMLNSHIEGSVREEITTAEEVRRSGLSESEWMARRSPRIHQLVSSGKYPIFTRIVTEAAHQPHLRRDDQFRNGLQHILDYIAVSLPPTPKPSPPHGTQPDPPGTHRDETPATATDNTPTRDETAPTGADEAPGRDETSEDLTPTPTRNCTVCARPTPQTTTGRPRQYCSRACQQRAYRTRTGAGTPA
ncbi:TetR/AcrR family transcriptional regulator [Streptomyces sp. NPDC059649]|uniref:TetR/AcrR family transcriptional regulator n=1 Tax=Streptomyces sp. NPDC059649 TaxID=3346895 RepID=UPI0036B05666